METTVKKEYKSYEDFKNENPTLVNKSGTYNNESDLLEKIEDWLHDFFGFFANIWRLRKALWNWNPYDGTKQVDLFVAGLEQLQIETEKTADHYKDLPNHANEKFVKDAKIISELMSEIKAASLDNCARNCTKANEFSKYYDEHIDEFIEKIVLYTDDTYNIVMTDKWDEMIEEGRKAIQQDVDKHMKKICRLLTGQSLQQVIKSQFGTKYDGSGIENWKLFKY